MMKRMILTLALLSVAAATVLSQTRWEGTAAAARYGEFPPGGYYAASSAFPRNTIVELTNASTGQTVEVIVVRRSENPGILMLLSQEAASALGVSPGSPVQVEARSVTQPNLTAVDPNEDLPFHPDPDINPAASVGDPNESIVESEEAATGLTEEAEDAPADAPRADEPVTVQEIDDESAEAAPRVAERAPDLSDRPAEPAPADQIEEHDEPEPRPQRSVVPVPREAPEPGGAEPQVTEPDEPEPAPPAPAARAPSRDLIPVPDRRPPVGEITEEPAPIEIEKAEPESEAPKRDVVPVPSRRPPRPEEPPREIVSEPEPDDEPVRPRRGVASGVTRTAGGLAVREIVEMPETALPRPAARDAGADIRVASPPEPRPPEEERVTEPPVPEIVAPPENLLDQAIAAVVGRMRGEELFPPPRAGAVATLLRRPEAPEETEVPDGRLAEAELPREQPAIVEAETDTPLPPEVEVVERPIEPVDPTGAELRPPAPPEGPVRGPLADARARLESPEIVERKEPPVDGIEGSLAEAEPDEVERRTEQPRKDAGPAVTDRIGEPEEQVEGTLPLAEIRTPETSVAVPEPPEEELDVAAATPRIEDGALIVRDDLDTGDLVPEDAILALEPADFRPPPVPEAEPGLDRLSPTEGSVVADGPEPSAERLLGDLGPDAIVDRATPTAKEIAEADRLPALPETPDALARAESAVAEVDGEAPVPGMPPLPDEIARPGADEAPLIADAREPAPPAEAPRPEGVPRVGREEGAVVAEEPVPREPGPPEPGMRADTDAEAPPRVARPDSPTPPAEEAEPASSVAERPEAEIARARDVAPPSEEVRGEEWASKNLPLVGKLSSGAYYLQVGAYSSARSAKSAVDVLDRDYPVAVLPTESDDRTVYRLFVGPLNEDERGTMLYWFRARGYKDAFIRKGD